MTLLSVVVPIYNEELAIKEFARCLKSELDKLGIEYQVIFVNDGSVDLTQKVIESIDWKQLEKYELQYNSGHMNAIYAGLEKSEGQFVLTMDSDLEHPPFYIKDFLSKQRETNADVVYGIRENRSSEKKLKKLLAVFYYFAIKKLTGVKLRSDAAEFRLISREVRNILISLPNYTNIYRILIPSLNFREEAIFYSVGRRIAGHSKYTLSRMMNLGIQSILSFSIRPLQIAIWIGFMTLAMSIIWIIYVFTAIFKDWVVPGWSSLIFAILFLSGIQLLILGIIGQYIGQIYQNQQNKPRFIFKKH